MEASSGRCFPGQDASRRRDSLEGEEGLRLKGTAVPGHRYVVHGPFINPEDR